MGKKKEKIQENPYEKIFDDAHRQLKSSGVDLSTIDGASIRSSKRGFVAPFPYGKPAHTNSGQEKNFKVRHYPKL